VDTRYTPFHYVYLYLCRYCKILTFTYIILGLSIHTFHGNFFVRSTDLLSLPNINPDAGFGMQMSIEDNLEGSHACAQAALLYTSSKGECSGVIFSTHLH
jgi:hypothetical protein